MTYTTFCDTISLIKKSSNISEEKTKVKFSKSIDGDTAKFELDGDDITARFLGINTPETVALDIPVQKWGPEASDYTKNSLQNAKKIEIEYDEKAQKKDKYNRDLVWIWVDDELLQEQLVLKGLAEQYMLQSNYKYADIIQEAESIAKENKVGLWSNEDKTAIAKNTSEEKVDITQDNRVVLIITFVLGIISILVKKVKRKSKLGYRKK